MPVAIHSRLWRRLHGYQDTVMEAQAYLITEEVAVRCAEIQSLQAEMWRRFRAKLSRCAPNLMSDFDRLALVEASEDQWLHKALHGEKECDGCLICLNTRIDRDKRDEQLHPWYGGEAA